MDEPISRSELLHVVDSLRRTLSSIDAGELSCSTGYRNQLRGAVVALEALTHGDPRGAAPESGEPPA